MTEASRQIGIVANVATWQTQFEDVVTRYSRFVFRIAYAILRNASDSEDVVQETFLRVYRSSNWNRVEDERAYLARIAWRLAVDLRAHSRTRPLAVDAAAVAAQERSLIDADRASTVHRLIDSLPEELRQPLALSTVDEMTSVEIAKVLGIAEGTVRTRLMRARQVLKQKLQAGGHV